MGGVPDGQMVKVPAQRGLPRACASGVLTALLLAMSSGTALAQSSNAAAAQGLFDEAKALMAAGKTTEACPKLAESQRLDPGSGTLLALARCYELSGRNASAWLTYLEAAAAAKTKGNAEREGAARDKASVLAKKVAKLTIEVPADSRVPSLSVTRDGQEVTSTQWGVAIPTDEGQHQVQASAPGHEVWSSQVTVEGAGQTTKVRVPKLAAAAEPARPPRATVEEPVARADEPGETARSSGPESKGLGAQRVGALVVGGVGVAGLAVGTVFGLQAMSKKDEADKTCNAEECSDQAGVDAGKDARAAGNISTVATIVGVVAVAGAAVLWFAAPSRDAVQVGFGLQGVQLRGSF